MSKFEKYFYIFLLILAIFTFGLQVGIYQGRVLEKGDAFYSYGY